MAETIRDVVIRVRTQIESSSKVPSLGPVIKETREYERATKRASTTSVNAARTEAESIRKVSNWMRRSAREREQSLRKLARLNMAGVRSQESATRRVVSLMKVESKEADRINKAKEQAIRKFEQLRVAGDRQADKSARERIQQKKRILGLLKAESRETDRLNKIRERTRGKFDKLRASGTVGGPAAIAGIAAGAAGKVTRLDKRTRRLNASMLEAGRAAEDFALGFSTTGWTGGIRGAANNLTFMAAQFGPIAGGLAGVGAALLVAVPFLYRWITATKDASKANERFILSLNRRKRAQAELISHQRLGMGFLETQAGVGAVGGQVIGRARTKAHLMKNRSKLTEGFKNRAGRTLGEQSSLLRHLGQMQEGQRDLAKFIEIQREGDRIKGGSWTGPIPSASRSLEYKRMQARRASGLPDIRTEGRRRGDVVMPGQRLPPQIVSDPRIRAALAKERRPAKRGWRAYSREPISPEVAQQRRAEAIPQSEMAVDTIKEIVSQTRMVLGIQQQEEQQLRTNRKLLKERVDETKELIRLEKGRLLSEKSSFGRLRPGQQRRILKLARMHKSGVRLTNRQLEDLSGGGRAGASVAEEEFAKRGEGALSRVASVLGAPLSGRGSEIERLEGLLPTPAQQTATDQNYRKLITESQKAQRLNLDFLEDMIELQKTTSTGLRELKQDFDDYKELNKN